jgi:hypothetical protein
MPLDCVQETFLSFLSFASGRLLVGQSEDSARIRALAWKQGAIEDLVRRLCEIRGRHVRKERFTARLAAIG